MPLQFAKALRSARIPNHIIKLFADAHEWGKSGLSTSMDFFNNHKGIGIGDKKGIYSLNSSSPTWAIGHVDIFLENKCSAGCHYNAPGLESIDLWVLD